MAQQYRSTEWDSTEVRPWICLVYLEAKRLKKNDFLFECAEKVRGVEFIMKQLLSDDLCFKASLDSVEEARKQFQPVPIKAFATKIAEEQKQLEDLPAAVLDRVKTLEQENQLLKSKAQECDACLICQREQVSVVLLPCEHSCVCKLCWKVWCVKWSQQSGSGTGVPCPACKQITQGSMETRAWNDAGA